MSAYILSREAQHDWFDIVDYTLDIFGEDQMIKYTEKLEHCIHQIIGSKGNYKELFLEGNVVRVVKCQKHYIFINMPKDQTPKVLAILHERMDWMNRLRDRLTDAQ